MMRRPSARGRPLKAGSPSQGQVQLGDVALAAQAADAVAELDVEVPRADKVEEGAPGVRRGDNPIGQYLLATGQCDAGRALSVLVTLDENPFDRRAGAQLGAGCPGRAGQRLDEAGEAAGGNAVGAALATEQAVEEREHGLVRRARGQAAADDSVPGQGGLEQVAREVLVHEVPHGQRRDAEELEHVFPAQAPQAQAEPGEGQELAGAAAADGGHRLQPEGRKGLAEGLQGLAVALVAGAIGIADALHRVRREGDMVPIDAEADGSQRRRVAPVAVPGEIEFAGDRRRELILRMRHGGVKTRVEFPACGEAAGLLGGLEHEHPLAFLCEVGSAGQAVVPGPDDDGVVTLHAMPRSELCRRKVEA